MAGLGRSLTDRGLTLYDIEKYRRATRVLRRAAHLLPASEKRNLAACYQGLSLCAIKEKRPLEALVHADKAGGFDLDLLHQGKLNWAVGIALFDAGEGNLAKTKFTRAMDFLAQVSPINAALCAIDFCEALLERGEAIAAHRTASAMSDLVGSLRNTREAQAALIELATIGLRGTGLTRALLSQNRARVSKAS
jgi:tetratricopeptide (TPR) repeat protein